MEKNVSIKLVSRVSNDEVLTRIQENKTLEYNCKEEAKLDEICYEKKRNINNCFESTVVERGVEEEKH